jgi:hypothetical protein
VTENLPALVQASDINRIERMAEAVAKSGLFGLKTKDQAMALMLVAESEGRHPASAAKDYHIINNNPSKKAEAMLRDFLLAGGKVEWHALNDTIADATFSHPQGGVARIDWTIARATTAGLIANANWKKYPRAMLRSRCVSEGVRSIYPAATSGMYVPEEVQDFDPPKKAKQEKPTDAVDVEYAERPLLDQAKEYADKLKACEDHTAFERLVSDNAVLTGKLATDEVALHKRILEIINERRVEFTKPQKMKKPKGSPAAELNDAIPEFNTPIDDTGTVQEDK